MGRPEKLQLDEILRRATKLFWTRGCDAVTTRDLEEALGIRAPGIYRRFPSKDALLARCIDYYAETVLAGRVERYLESAQDPMEGLHEFFTSAIAPDGRDMGSRGCLLANTAAHLEAQVPEVRAALHRGWHLIDSAFQRHIQRAQEAGQLDSDQDPAALSQALLMSLQGLLTISRVAPADMRPGIDATLRLLGWSPAAEADRGARA